jgi:sugar lactone lactonase YvrE
VPFSLILFRLSEVRVVRSSRYGVQQYVFAAIALAAVFGGRLLQAEDFHYPLKPAAAEHGPVYVADLRLPGVLVVKDGKVDSYFVASKKLGTPLCRVRSLAIDHDGKVLAGDSSTREVYRFDQPGKPTPLIKGAQAGIGIPISLAVDSKGNIFVADLEVHWIWKLAPTGGAPQRFAEVPAPGGMAIDSHDRLWVISNGNDQLLRISPDAKIEVVVAGRPFQHPNDVALGPDETAYVSDGYAHTIWKVVAGAKPQAWISGAPLVNPGGLAWHDGSLIIADPNPKAKTGQVYKADSAGKLSPLAGK